MLDRKMSFPVHFCFILEFLVPTNYPRESAISFCSPHLPTWVESTHGLWVGGFKKDISTPKPSTPFLTPMRRASALAYHTFLNPSSLALFKCQFSSYPFLRSLTTTSNSPSIPQLLLSSQAFNHTSSLLYARASAMGKPPTTFLTPPLASFPPPPSAPPRYKTVMEKT